MEKNWLIRTKSNHILGPISKEKVIELYGNGSIKADDEVCSGNGFWFFIREDDMVERFLIGNETQSFNPISEAKDVLTTGHAPGHEERVPDDITRVGGINLDDFKASQNPPEAKKSTPLSIVSEPGSEVKKKVKSDSPLKTSTNLKSLPNKKLAKQPYLQYLIYLGFFLLVSVLYFRKNIIRHLFESSSSGTSFSLIQEVYAQDGIPEKKKSF